MISGEYWFSTNIVERGEYIEEILKKGKG